MTQKLPNDWKANREAVLERRRKVPQDQYTFYKDARAFNQPVKNLPLYRRYPVGFQLVVIGISGVILFSKQIYDVYNVYFGSKPIPKPELKLQKDS